MQIGHKMTELEAFEVLSVVLEHPVLVVLGFCWRYEMVKHLMSISFTRQNVFFCIY